MRMLVVLFLWPLLAQFQAGVPMKPGVHRIEVRSTLDGSLQPSYLAVPDRPSEDGRMPLLVMLHTWSFDLESRFPPVEQDAMRRGWIVLTPNFRGRNDHPEACGSRLAQQDILDAVEWVCDRAGADGRRVYLLGWSGGGFMALLMAARHPHVWAAVSAWAGISDLRAFHAEHERDELGAQLRGCFGGPPHDDPEREAAYRERSPLTHLRPDLGVPIDLAVGRSDPQVSPRQTLRAFRAVAPEALTDLEIERLLGGSSLHNSEDNPQFPAPIVLRRTSGQIRLTIFEGLHTWFYKPALEWLARHRRD